MLKLKELRLSGIGVFTEEQVLDFSSLGSLVQVDGQNQNTGGSSGSGKSTIFNALEYLLGLNDLSNSILQSRLTKEGISVKGLFELDGKPLAIERGKSKFAIDFDGEMTSGSSKITEEKLDQILGIPRKLFRPMLHKRQKEGGFFLDLTPQKMNDFLTDCLGLSDYRVKLETIDAKIKDLSQKKASDETAFEAVQAALKATLDGITALGDSPVLEVDTKTVLTLKSASEAAQAALNELLVSHDSEFKALQKERPELTSTNFKSRADELEAELKRIRDLAQRLMLDEKERQSRIKTDLNSLKLKRAALSQEEAKLEFSHSQIAKLAAEVKKLRENLCPTCEQSWITDTAKAKEVALISEIKKHKEQIDLANKATHELLAVESQIQDLEMESQPKLPEGLGDLAPKEAALVEAIRQEKLKESSHRQKEAEDYRARFDAFNKKQSDLRQKHALESSHLRERAAQASKEFDTATQKLVAQTTAIKRHEASLKALSEKREAYATKAAELETSLKTVQDEVALAEEVRKAIKSFVSRSFDDAIEEIGDAATRIIRSIPNMANATIQFEGVRETQSGKVKEEVNAVISKDGEIGVPIKSLSGGERSSVDLAVDLAVVDLIETRANKGIDLFILDEGFTGLDSTSVEMVLEVLKNAKINKKIIIVDHNEVVKEMVEQRVVVIRDGATSRIVQN